VEIDDVLADEVDLLQLRVGEVLVEVLALLRR
jgi:hypothetical protein